MARLEARQRVAYFAPTANRHYFTRKAAAVAEARAMILAKYPTEREESENGRIYSRGWFWREDERLCRVHDRLWRKIYHAKVLP